MLLRWIYSRLYIETKISQNEKIKFKEILKKKNVNDTIQNFKNHDSEKSII
jgi:uncharacterized FlgJ-related protein